MGIKRILPFNNCFILPIISKWVFRKCPRATLGIEDISFGHKAKCVSYDELTLPHSRTIFYMHSLKFLLTLLTTKMLCYNSFFQFQVPPTASNLKKHCHDVESTIFVKGIDMEGTRRSVVYCPVAKEQWDIFSFALKSYSEV